MSMVSLPIYLKLDIFFKTFKNKKKKLVMSSLHQSNGAIYFYSKSNVRGVKNASRLYIF